MRLAARMTTGYDVRQDRMCLSVLDQQRRPVRIWLTQRLAGRVIAALLARLQKAAAAAPSGPRAPRRARPRAAAAPSRHSAPPPVPAGGEDCLPTGVQIRTARTGLLLVFVWPGAGAQSIAVPLDAPRLRQWLKTFYNNYRRAGWPLDIWPRWLEEQDALAPPPGASLH